jgi:hypothetical protein
LNYAGAAGNFKPGQCDYFGGSPVLPQVIGWIVVVAFGGGAFCALGCLCFMLALAAQESPGCRQSSRLLASRVILIYTNTYIYSRGLLPIACSLFVPAVSFWLGHVHHRQCHLSHMSAFFTSYCTAVFTLFTSIALWLDSRFTAGGATSEAYTTAGRNVQAGLTACDIVSE